MGLVTIEHNVPTIVEVDAWAQLAADWLQNFTSAATRTTYKAAWGNFLQWFDGHPSKVTRAHIIAYRDHLAATLKPATVGVRMAALASFYAQASAEGLIDRNPVEGVSRPKVKAYSGARWLTDSEARALLHAPDRSTIEGQRDYAILVLALTTGLRRASLANIHIGDLSTRGDGAAELRYRPKGGEDQVRPLPPVAWLAIQAYIEARGAQRDEPLFVAHDHAAGTRSVKAMTGSAIWYLVKRYTVRALGRQINPHALRHTCANAAYETTHDMRRVQDLLGHASVATTELYMHRASDNRDALGTALGARWGIA